MRQTVVSVLLLFLLSACAIGNKYDYRAATPELQAKSPGAVAVGVHDRRPYVVSNDKRTIFVGLQRGGYGNPFDVTTLSGHALADDFAQVIVDALGKNDILASTVLLSPQDGRKAALQTLADTDAERVIFVTLDEWKSDNFINVALIYNLSAEVLDSQGRVLAESRQQGQDALGAGVGFNLSTAVGGLVVEGTKRVLNALLNDGKIVAALASKSSGPKVADATTKPVEGSPPLTKPALTSDTDSVNPGSSQKAPAATAQITAVPASESSNLEVVDAATNPVEDSQPPTEPALTPDPDGANPNSSQKAPAVAKQSALAPVRQSSNAERERVTSFIRNNDHKVKSRLASYNTSKRIGRDNNSPIFSITTISHVFVRAVDGERAAVELGFSSGYRVYPSYHKYLYDVQFSGGDFVILGHEKL